MRCWLLIKFLTNSIKFWQSYDPWQFLAIFYVETLLARYLENYLSYGLDIWFHDWGLGKAYLIIFWTNFEKFWQPFEIFSSFTLLARYLEKTI